MQDGQEQSDKGACGKEKGIPSAKKGCGRAVFHVPDKKESLLEWTLLPVNTFKNPDHIKDGRHNYLVEENEKQYLVQLYYPHHIISG